MPIKPHPSCKFCGKSNLQEFTAQERMLGLGHEFTYQHCQDCGSLQLKVIPKNLAEYYPKDYYSFNPLVKTSGGKKLVKKLRMKGLFAGIPLPTPVYGPWLKKLNLGFHEKIADVGCGNGQLLYELHAGGFTDLQGFDPFIDADSEIEAGLKLWKKGIEESTDTFDVIMMHHAFEHMADPRQVLKTCYAKLKPEGRLLLRTPIADAVVFEEEKDLWVQLDAPRHLVICSQRGFQSLAEQAGFDLDETVFDSEAFQFLGTELYKRGLSLSQEHLEKEFSASEKEKFHKKALQYNQEGKGDQVCFYLSRKD